MITPYDFGKHIGKQAFLLPAVSGIADGLLAPSGHRMEGVGRGVTKGVGGSVGSAVGVPTGIAGAIALALINPRLGRALFGASRNQLGNIGKKVVHKWNGTGIRPLTPIQKIYGQNLITRGGTAGAIGGGIAGIAGTSALMGKPSWEQKTSAAPAPAPVAADPGARTKAMINGMRQQGISSGQWADNGAAGFSPTNITHSAAAKAKAQPTTPVTPAAQPTPAAPAPITTRTKSRSAF